MTKAPRPAADTPPRASGRCRCGRVRYTLSPAPIDALICHCADCRQHSGQAASAWVETLEAHLQLQGEPLQYRQSSAHARRGFCPACQTPITYRMQIGDFIDFGVMLDLPHREAVRIACHIWTRSKTIDIDDDLPQYEQDLPDVPVG